MNTSSARRAGALLLICSLLIPAAGTALTPRKLSPQMMKKLKAARVTTLLNESELVDYYRRLSEQLARGLSKKEAEKQADIHKRTWRSSSDACTIRMSGPSIAWSYKLQDASHVRTTSTGVEFLCKAGKKCLRQQHFSPNVTSTFNKRTFKVIPAKRRNDLRANLNSLINQCGGGGRA